VTRGWLPQRARLPGLNGGGTAAAVPPTKHNHSQHENLNNHERKLLIYAEMKANKLKPGAGAFYAT